MMEDIPYTIKMNTSEAIRIRIALHLAFDDRRGDALGKRHPLGAVNRSLFLSSLLVPSVFSYHLYL